MNVKEMRSQVRMQEWVTLIKERNASGMTIREWCEAKGLNENQYYYWLRKIRWSACTALEAHQNALTDMPEEEPVFAELDVCPGADAAPIYSGITIRKGRMNIHIGSDVSIEQIAAVMKEIRYAE